MYSLLGTCVQVEHGKTGIRVPETPLRRMIKNCPDGASMILDRMYDVNEEELDEVGYQVHVDYQFLDDALSFEVDKKSKKICDKS